MSVTVRIFWWVCICIYYFSLHNDPNILNLRKFSNSQWPHIWMTKLGFKPWAAWLQCNPSHIIPEEAPIPFVKEATLSAPMVQPVQVFKRYLLMIPWGLLLVTFPSLRENTWHPQVTGGEKIFASQFSEVSAHSKLPQGRNIIMEDPGRGKPLISQ